MIVFIRGLHGFVVGRLGFYLFSFPGPSCFCFNSIGEKVKPSPSLKSAELETWVGRMAPYRSSAQLGPSLTLSSLTGGARLTVGLISSQVSILEQITVWEQVTPQMYHWRPQAFNNCWDVILPNKRQGHMPIFLLSMSHQGAWLSQDTAKHSHPWPWGWTANGHCFWGTEFPWLHLVKAKTHAWSHSQRCRFHWSGVQSGHGALPSSLDAPKCHWDCWELLLMEKCN